MDEIIKKHLFDIRTSIESIEEYIGPDKDFLIYRSNKMLRRSVERELEIIGEAINRINKINPQIIISGIKQIIGFRNRIIHNYDSIDDTIVWGIIIKYLPVLKKEVIALLDN